MFSPFLFSPALGSLSYSTDFADSVSALVQGLPESPENPAGVGRPGCFRQSLDRMTGFWALSASSFVEILVPPIT